MPSNKSDYKHRKINFEIAQDPYLKRNQASFQRLKDIYDQKVDYVPDDYQIVILCFERLYKGTYRELYSMGAKIPYISEEELLYGPKDEDGKHHHPHSFKKFAKTINSVIPLADDKEKYYDILNTIVERLQPAYTPCRFTKDIPFEEFQKDFRRLETHTYRLYKGMEQVREQLKDATNTLEEPGIELDDWS